MFRMLMIGVALTLLPTVVSAAPPQHAAATMAPANEVVRYQLKDWKAKHIHDTKKADTIAKTLKKLGCEVKTDQHNGHLDVKYRCPEWHELKLDSHDDAHKWEKWLKEFHFTTEHKH
ncbi:hypothetical protein [Novipirellula rosea]|uniref:Uncharacterized protein n=1 Tax=Novipirellula rosea TaxID=1031540 RepID=A0ABP8NCX3_9BACT